MNMTSTMNTYLVVYEVEEGEVDSASMIGFTMADVDEAFARMYPDSMLVEIRLVGELLTEEEQ